MKEEQKKTKRKKGKIFFLTLIILSGIAVFSLLFLAFEGDRVTSYMIEKYVLSRDLLDKEFTEEVTTEERKRIVSDLHLFFESARAGVETKERVASIGGKLREMMEDHKITREEVQELETLLKNK